jgi:hypothetical protein
MNEKHNPITAVLLWIGAILFLGFGWSLPSPFPQMLSIIGLVWLVALIGLSLKENPRGVVKAMLLAAGSIVAMIIIYLLLVLVLGKPA